MRYVYLGDKLTDPRLVGQECDPVYRRDGKPYTTIRGTRPRNQLVRFANGELHAVLGRRLRLTEIPAPAPHDAARRVG